jgi:ABC-type antimicrobial peptide transport system permease subunit
MARASLRALVTAAVRTRRTRSAVAIAGIAASSLLVLVLAAALRSLSEGLEAYVNGAGGDLWVGPAGTDNFMRSGGFIPLEWEEGLKALPGVSRVDPVLRSFARVEAGSRHTTQLVLGWRGPDGLGGPAAIVAGHPLTQAGEVMLDRTAAFRLRVGVGDIVRAGEVSYRVAGLTRGTNLLAVQLLFADYGAVEDVLGTYGRTSFLVVRVDSGAAKEEVAARVRKRFPMACVVTRQAFLANNLYEATSGFRPLLVLVALLGLAVAGVFVALLTQGLVEDKRSDVAVLLAIGTPATTVIRGALHHLLGVMAAGYLAGVALARATGWILDDCLPTVALTFGIVDAVVVGVVFLAAGVVAALLPILRLQSVDPLEAFRP